MFSTPRILLASKSPRRKQILESLGLPFSSEEPNATEVFPSTDDVEKIAMKNAELKAASISRNLLHPETVVLGADTLVLSHTSVLGKPGNPVEAERFLRLLSGQTHKVVTGICLQSATLGSCVASCVSEVIFRPLSDSQIASYVRTKEPYDKAGGYAVQGLGSVFIEGVRGSYTNVMGLPVESLLENLEILTSLSRYAWFS